MFTAQLRSWTVLT